VVPLLQTYSFVRIWVPSSGTGADAYSLAAVLEEAGVLDKCIIYATAFSEVGTEFAKIGTYPHTSEGEVAALAHQAGIVSPLSRYFDLTGTHATATETLRRNLMFARHNPAEDGSINEFHAIIARNMFPLFNGAVQYRMHRLIFDSILHLGFICLGQHESLANTVHEGAFRKMVEDQPIYRRMR
jgi:chemotaxis protein methyltransferase CheR